MSQQEFRSITGEVAIDVNYNISFTGFTCLSWQRAKKAIIKLIAANYDATINKLDNKIIILSK